MSRVILTDCGTSGLGMDLIEIDSDKVASVSVDPARPDEPKSVVTLDNGEWFLVLGTFQEVRRQIWPEEG